MRKEQAAAAAMRKIMGFKRFKQKKQALGHFWAKHEIDNIWEGQLNLDSFPTLELITLIKQDISPDTKTIHGVSKDAEYFSLFNTIISPATWYHSSSLRADKAKAPVGGKIYTIFADYMLVGSTLYYEEPTVQRVSFFSALASDAFCIRPDVTFSDLKFRRTSRGFRQPLLRKMTRSTFLYGSQPMRVRCIKPTVPAAKDERCQFVISFLKKSTPYEALIQMLALRDLLTFLSGTYIDLTDPELHHVHDSSYSNSQIYFGDPRRTRPEIDPDFLAIVPLMANAVMFRTVLSRWARENETYRRARRVFNDILLDDDKVTFSHLRDLVTIIEMIIDEDARLIPRDLFNRLREKLNTAAQDFLRGVDNSDMNIHDGVAKIMHKVDYLNRDNANQKMRTAIYRIPEELRQQFFADADSFSRAAIKFRDHLTHDMTRLRNEDYLDVNWYVAKLKAIYAINEAVRLSSESNINQFCAIIREAISAGLKAPSAQIPTAPT